MKPAKAYYAVAHKTTCGWCQATLGPPHQQHCSQWHLPRREHIAPRNPLGISGMSCFLASHLVWKMNPIGKSTTGVPSQVGDLHQPVGGFIIPIQIFPPKRGDLVHPQNLAYLGPWLDLLTIGTSTIHISMQIHKYTKIVKHTSMIYSFGLLHCIHEYQWM